MTAFVPLSAAISVAAEFAAPGSGGRGQFVGMEHVESGTGRRIGSAEIDLASTSGSKQRFQDGDIVYGRLRPYLNKVWLADFGGFCSVDQTVFRVNELFDPSFVASFMRSPAFLSQIVPLIRGELPRIRNHEVLAVLMPLLALSEQRLVATGLNQQLVQAATANRLTRATAKSVRQLGLAVLSNRLHRASREWPARRLGEVSRALRSPSTKSDGDTEVATVTSGALTPFGFSFDGLGSARMSGADAVAATISTDEVLVSRSNTESLVGRASKYPGGPRAVVASDLVFRIVPDRSFLLPGFLAYYLVVLQLDGYWRDRSSGASSTMKKITKTLLAEVEIPIPPLAEQAVVTQELHEFLRTIEAMQTAIRAEEDATQALPAALLRRAFEREAA